MSSSAAIRINLAASTSALAEIILLSASLRSLAADERLSCRSLLSWMSLMKISSIYLLKGVRQRPTPQRTGQPASQYRQRSIVVSRAGPAG